MGASCCDIVPKFGGPGLRYYENEHWLVQVRPKQVTLGSSVMIARRHLESLAGLEPAEAVAFGAAVREVEARLKKAFGFDKINYLALMMVDRHLHVHVIPRYSVARSFAGREWRDSFWPKAPDVGVAVEPEPAVLETLHAALRSGKA